MIRAFVVEGGARGLRQSAEWLISDYLGTVKSAELLGLRLPIPRTGGAVRLDAAACADAARALADAGPAAFAAAFERRLPGEFPAAIAELRERLAAALAAGARSGGLELASD